MIYIEDYTLYFLRSHLCTCVSMYSVTLICQLIEHSFFAIGTIFAS